MKKVFSFILDPFYKKRSEKIRKMSRLFDWQMKNLKELGIVKNLIETLESQKDDVISYALRIKYLSRYDLEYFFPVLPIQILNMGFDHPLVPISQNDIKEGNFVNINESIEFEDIYDLQNYSFDLIGPYFVFGFESGMTENSVATGAAPIVATEAFKIAKIEPLNIAEAISMLIHFHNFYNGGGEKLCILGSRYRSLHVPEFFRNKNDFKLSWDYYDNPDSKKVYPACLDRQTFML